MDRDEKRDLHKAISDMQRAVDNLSNELALLRNRLYVPAKPGDFKCDSQTIARSQA